MNSIPLQFPSPGMFARVRRGFEEMGYNGQSVDEQMHREPRLMTAYVHGQLVSGLDAAHTLTRLFFGGTARAAELRSLLGAQMVEDLRALGLIEHPDEETVRPTIRLRPMLGLYVAADLHQRYEEHNADFVYPPDGANTHEYITHLPARFHGNFLEACGGTGVAALIAASRGAAHASTFDISERCSQFAAFSARLSGLENFTAATGDAFAPAAGQRFDTIAMHPPYVPVLESNFVFSDGGQDGEAITRRHIEATPAHLNPGGRLYCRCMATDRKGQPFEARLRQWLGASQGEFDIALETTRRIEPVRLFRERPAAEPGGRRTREEIVQWLNMVDALKIERFILCAFILQRHSTPREAFTVRRDAGSETRPHHLAWLMQWHSLCAGGEAESIVLQSGLRANAAALTTRHDIRDGDWVPQLHALAVESPYPLRNEVDDLAVYLLPRLDGRSGMEMFRVLQGELGMEDPGPFGRYVAELVGRGFVLVS